MKKLTFIIALLALNLTTIAGSTKSLPKQITISGFVSDTCIKTFSDSLLIYFYDQYNEQLWRESKLIPARIIKNRYFVTIQPKGDVAYCRIRDGRETKNLGTFLKADAFLITAGDQLVIDFHRPGEIKISGKGSEKINYQRFAGKLSKSWGAEWKLYKQLNTDRVNYWRNLNDKHLTLAVDSLNKIKPLISEVAYKILRYNVSAAINSAYIDHLTTLLAHKDFPATDSNYIKAVQNEFRIMDNIQQSFQSTDPTILKYSTTYITYLGDFQLIYNRVMNQNSTIKFKEIFDKISSQYHGILRDKLLTYAINEGFQYSGSFNYIPEALHVVEDTVSKSILENTLRNKAKGAKVIDFAFEDINGKMIRLEDLKGKVVVLEAWFNGCTGCIGLAKRMHPVVEHYKNNSNVVFISLCVDRDRRRFLDGVKSGKYGSGQSTYLYTNGKGWEHPFCLRYQWSNFGYPQMLFIDKNGNLISANKIDPVNEMKKQELIRFIDLHI